MRAALLCLLLACAHASDAAEAQCRRDEDCAVTRVREGSCCKTLCTPRPVSADEGARLEEASRSCETRCPIPACRPESTSYRAACVQNRCSAIKVPAATEP
jgi:hypothetical protein